VSTSSNTVPTETSTVITPAPLAISPQQSETATPADDLDSLPEVDAEEEASHSIEARIVNNKTRIEVSTAWESTRLSIVATKKGSKKKYTYRFSTDSSGNYLFKSSINLKGFTLTLYKGSEELVREIV
jgi:predicted transcriptional regulator